MVSTLHWSIGIDPSFSLTERSAFLLTIVTLALSTLFLCTILIERARLKRQTRIADAALSIWRPLLTAGLAGEQPQLPLLPAAARLPVLLLWIKLLRNVSGNARSALIETGRRGHFEAAARAMLRHRDRRRLLALAVLVEFGENEDIPYFERTLWSRSARVSVLAARGLLACAPRKGLDILLDAYARGLRHPLRDVSALLEIPAPELIQEALHRQLGKTPDVPSRLIPALGYLAAGEQPGWMQQLLEDPDPQRVADALRVASDPRLATAIRKLTIHTVAFVRLQAVRALGRIGSVEDIPALRHCLEDPDWWVRYRAASAILALDAGMDDHPMLVLVRSESI